MIGKQEQILSHEILSPATSGAGLTILSKLIPYGGEAGWILVVKNGATITGTTPGIIWELDATTVAGGGSGMTRVGGAIATYLAVGLLVVPYILNSTQGAVGSTSTFIQVKGVIGNADNVITDISVDLIAVQ
jgi:hypothetical protein